jgi:hypothetical protein
VKEGRRELNFSIWDRYEQRRKARELKEIVKEVEEGEMPPWYYVPVHPHAKLAQGDREAIVNGLSNNNKNSVFSHKRDRTTAQISLVVLIRVDLWPHAAILFLESK